MHLSVVKNQVPEIICSPVTGKMFSYLFYVLSALRIQYQYSALNRKAKERYSILLDLFPVLTKEENQRA